MVKHNEIKGRKRKLLGEVPSEYSGADRRLLALVYALAVRGQKATLSSLADAITVTVEYLEQRCGWLVSEGLLAERRGAFELTNDGRKAIRVVMVGGAFDILHPGHLHVLSRARELGDALVVSVARNVTFERMRGRRPVNDEKVRAALVSSLRMVDAAVLGSKKDIYETVERVQPDIIALGYDQIHEEKEVAQEVRKRGLSIEVVRIKSFAPGPHTSEVVADKSRVQEF